MLTKKIPKCIPNFSLIHERCLLGSMYFDTDDIIKCDTNPLLLSICNEMIVFTRACVPITLLWSLCYDIYAFI